MTNTASSQSPESWKRTTALFLASQTISLIGSSLVQYALMWTVTLETRSGSMMTMYIIAGFVPTFLLSPFAGVWVDRYNRKRIIIAADALIALVTLALALAFMSGERSLWLIFVAAAIRSVGTAVHGPAVGAILPDFVPTDQLMRVGGINSTLQSLNMLLSPVVAGALMSSAPLQTLFFIDAITAFIAIGILVFFVRIPLRASTSAVTQTSHLNEMRQGFQYIRTHRYLVTYFFFIAAILILVTPAAFLTPLQTARTFGPEVWRLTAIEIVFSVGMLIGGAVLSITGGFSNRMKTILFSTAIMGVCTAGLGVATPFWFYLVFMGVFGVAMPLHMTPSTVMLQEHVEPAYLGRVLSVSTMLTTSVFPLSMLLFGPLAEVMAIETLLLITGALVILLAIAVPLNKRLMQFGEPPASPSVEI